MSLYCLYQQRIKEMSGKYTQGPVIAVLIADDDPESDVEPEWRITQPDGSWLATAWVGTGDDPNDEAKANAELIEEVFNVAHESGLTPRKLVNYWRDAVALNSEIAENMVKLKVQRDELLAALLHAKQNMLYPDQMIDDAIEKATK
jgi:hypothetical protein